MRSSSYVKGRIKGNKCPDKSANYSDFVDATTAIVGNLGIVKTKNKIYLRIISSIKARDEQLSDNEDI